MGQELCYLCHQRALHNVPVDVSQERREKEKAEDMLLQEYQQQKDLLSLAREQATKNKNRQFNQEIALFNLETAKNKVHSHILAYICELLFVYPSSFCC